MKSNLRCLVRGPPYVCFAFRYRSFFLRGEVVLNVEELSKLWNRLVLHQRADFRAAELDKGGNIQKVGSRDHLIDVFY